MSIDITATASESDGEPARANSLKDAFQVQCFNCEAWYVNEDAEIALE